MPKAGRLKQGTKTSKNNWEKNPRKVAKGNPVGARLSGKSLDFRSGETAIQGGGQGK
jgi:hypothetical protein